MNRREEDMSEESWENFNPRETLPPSVSDRMFKVIETHIQPPASKIRRLYFRWASIAALFLVIVSVWIWGSHKKTSSSLPQATAAVHPEEPVFWKSKLNHTGKTMLISLPDSSLVELADKSVLRYPEPFVGNKRDLYLNGQALFKVAKDKSRSFTVHAGGFSTTALGTEFRVTADEGRLGSTTEVALLSGKVVVRPDSLLRSKGIKEIYLSPGQLYHFDPLKGLVYVHPIEKTAAPGMKVATALTGKILRFNDESLPEIFTTLEKECSYHLIYNKDQLADIRFTGVFNGNKETLKDFLSTITLLNSLSLIQKNNAFYIK